MSATILQPNLADPFERLCRKIHALIREGESTEWAKARLYLEMYPALKAAVSEANPKARGKPKALARLVNERLDRTHRRLFPKEDGICRTWLSNLLKTHEIFLDFLVNQKSCPLEHYRRMAASKIRRETKEALRQWIESEPVTQSQLRYAIRRLIDEERGIYRHALRLKRGVTL